MKELQKGWLPIGLPDDIKLLKEMILWEAKYGDAKALKRMENKLKKLEEKK